MPTCAVRILRIRSMKIDNQGKSDNPDLPGKIAVETVRMWKRRKIC